MLSHPLGISGLVGRYPANYLVPRKPLPRRNLTICSPDHRARRDRPVLPGVSPGYPGPGGTLPTPYYPVSRSSSPRRGLVARLACLIHAANVHSEPGSNPSERSLHPAPENPTRGQAADAGEKANRRFDLRRNHLPVASDGRWPSPATSPNSNEFVGVHQPDCQRSAERNPERCRSRQVTSAVQRLY
jgi:hypothetical protein